MDGVLQRKNELDEGGRKVRPRSSTRVYVCVCVCVGERVRVREKGVREGGRERERQCCGGNWSV